MGVNDDTLACTCILRGVCNTFGMPYHFLLTQISACRVASSSFPNSGVTSIVVRWAGG